MSSTSCFKININSYCIIFSLLKIPYFRVSYMMCDRSFPLSNQICHCLFDMVGALILVCFFTLLIKKSLLNTVPAILDGLFLVPV